MNNNSLFDFNVDKSAQTVVVNMEFDADISLVWDAFTKAEIIDQWYAPAPMTTKTKEMDFRVGGRRFFAMITPEGQELWAIQDYKSITPKTNFTMFNCFSDKEGNPQPPGSDWDLSFTDGGESTKVRISIYNESLERMEKLMSGFQQGFTASLNNLRELLARLSKK